MWSNVQPVGTWSVTATYGEPVPELGALAAGELACEIIRSLSGEDCRLPATVTSLVRQGVTIQYPDLARTLETGKIGLYLCDLFLQTYNPHGLVRRAATYSVDGPDLRRAT